ncbi:neurofilament light polypeptide [Vigna radiata var. radiata]|uniref:Neurofilament light polypeptide n=1 Tax=Vigna radiata var. radiata TaxID=3916 RepID=A0A1S3VWN6_VIGRR|nr:neurofilament light polypeptide [Vigna radiata var. radiata]
MDQVKSLKIKSFIQSTELHHHVIKLIQLLLSLSVFSFFVSPSSLLAFLYHFNLYFSTFSLQLFTHTIDKNCMFLLCNGLLVFVGITKSLSGSTSIIPDKYVEGGSQSSYSDVEANEPIMLVQKTHHEPEEQKIEAEHAIEIKFSVEEGEQNIVSEGEEEGKKNIESALKEEDEPNAETGAEDEEKESEIGEFLIGESVEEEDAVEEEANWVLSTEELNKKFDDFIRKMKEDLRIEAQRQLLMV